MLNFALRSSGIIDVTLINVVTDLQATVVVIISNTLKQNLQDNVGGAYETIRCYNACVVCSMIV